MSTNIKPGRYTHYKDETKEYELVGIGKHSETLEDLVIYRALYKNDLSQIWVRPIESFLGTVEVNGKQIPRFRYIGSI